MDSVWVTKAEAPKTNPFENSMSRVLHSGGCRGMSGVSWYTLSSVVSRWKTVSERNFNSSGKQEYKSETNNPVQISVSLPWTWLETPHTHKYLKTVSSIPATENMLIVSPQQQPWLFHQRHTKHPDETSCCFLAETWNQIQPGPRPCTKYPGSQGWDQWWPMGEYRLWSICLEENSTV